MEHPKIKIAYNTSEDDIRNKFFLPCLKWASVKWSTVYSSV